MKTCIKCGEAKCLSSFTKDKKSADGLYAFCKPCKRARQKEYYKNNNGREKSRAYYVEKLYGITMEDYEAMFEAQGKSCACCGSTDPQGKNFHVDHCHKTGAVRSILCHPCNTALGLLKEDVQRIDQLKNYVQLFESDVPQADMDPCRCRQG